MPTLKGAIAANARIEALAKLPLPQMVFHKKTIMRGKLIKEGSYELFQTNNHNDILSLDQKKWYALIKTKQGDIIVHSDSDHERKKTLSKGKFYLVDFKDDPEFQDMPHLFMEEKDHFRELILPNGLPTKKDHQKKLVRPEDTLSKAVVEEHVKGKGNKGSEKQYEGQAEGLRNKTKEELYKMAQERDLEGRSIMNKEELVQKLKED